MAKKVGITETILRDAHQSLIATRMTTEDMLPIVAQLDDIGYHSLEAWGGATFDSCLRFLNEDPWERLRKFKSVAKKTPLQMLFRGQNILGYRHYADDVVEYFVQKSIANGIDILRIFDALNDVRNFETAIRAAKKEKGHVQAAVSYTISPVHNNQTFIDLAKLLESMGADSICIKDMAGLLTPYAAYDLVKGIKSAVKIPLQLHTHYTSGVASMTYLKAIEAGVDVVDCALSPFAMGTSQPPTEPLVATLRGTEYDTGISLEKVSAASEYFKPLREKYLKSGLLDPKMLGVDVNTLIYQVPGGMLSNLVSQLKQQNREDQYEEVLREVPRVREDFGYPPLVTPTSQIVGTQAVLNVLMGERYKMVSKESKALVKGEYGTTPVPISDEFRKRIIGDETPITVRPADLIQPELEKLRGEIKEYIERDEDVLSYALFDQVAVKFFEKRRAAKYKIEPSMVDLEEKTHPV
ncbi:MAG: oxaloacetate decarboxylase subunit alpha [Clostridiales bacterium]|jgi:oxaloacetate decarboxylase alpha subunit|nr:oxaloacetate decarboxylase subunit alpha [Clostridiales bacterium]